MFQLVSPILSLLFPSRFALPRHNPFVLFLPQYPPRFSLPISMNSGPVDATALLTSLETSQDFEGLYHRFSSFFQPFENFIFLDDYSLSAVKKKTGREKKPKELPSKEKILPIARQFHQFLCKSLKLLPDLLRRIPSNGAEGEEGMHEERAAELLGIYRLTIHCLLCIAPCLTGPLYSVHLQWGQLVRRLETWNKYNYAKEEGFALLESLHTFLVTPPPLLKPTMLFLPDPGVVGLAGTDPQLACLVSEVDSISRSQRLWHHITPSLSMVSTDAHSSWLERAIHLMII